MKLSSNEQDAIVGMLTRIYMDILPIEEEYRLLVGDHDFRPRIEYFHDAIRAFTAETANAREIGGRLSVEQLAYDVSALRYIQSTPLAALDPKGESLSPQTDLVKVKPGLLVPPKHPDRRTRETLSSLYQHYAVLFAALLKPLVDQDYKDRIEDINQDISSIHYLIENLTHIQKNPALLNQIASNIQHLNDEKLRQLLSKFVQQQKYVDKQSLDKIIAFLPTAITDKKSTIKAIEDAHLQYALTQLAIFENSKDMLKQLASQGANIVGKFVEDAISKAQREINR